MSGHALKLRHFALLAIAGLALGAHAQSDYPARTVKIIVPFAAGGSTDVLARVTGQVLTKALGHSFIVENRPGASGNIGAEVVALAAPDGYTLLFTSTNLTLNPAVTKNLPYDAVRDFAPVTMVAFAPMVLITRPDFGGGNIRDLVAYLKANPGKTNYSSSGKGGAPHLAGEMFKLGAGLDIVHVPYNGAAPALTDVVSGQVQMTFTTYISAQSLLQGGRVKVVAVASGQRLPLLPGVPTFAEAGYKGIEIGTMFGLLAPAKTPSAVIQKIYGAIRDAAKSEELKQQILMQGGEVVVNSPEVYTRYIAEDVDKWKKLIARIGDVGAQ
jgi:tripartite-type tricarboxylate transporter receptor subunit TctC